MYACMYVHGYPLIFPPIKLSSFLAEPETDALLGGLARSIVEETHT